MPQEKEKRETRDKIREKTCQNKRDDMRRDEETTEKT